MTLCTSRRALSILAGSLGVALSMSLTMAEPPIRNTPRSAKSPGATQAASETAIPIDRQKLFGEIRTTLFNGKLSQDQVEGCEIIIDKFYEKGLRDLRWLAYLLATTKWETAHTMQPIEEYGKGKKHAYGAVIPETGKAYYGRGYVQLTWAGNYQKMGALLGKDLYHQPELALDADTAANILIEGMTPGASKKGDFTGKHLGQYFNSEVDDPVGARRIVNGTDRAEIIADMHTKFLTALKNAQQAPTTEPSGP